MHVAEQALWNTRVRMYALGFNLMQTMAETKKTSTGAGHGGGGKLRKNLENT